MIHLRSLLLVLIFGISFIESASSQVNIFILGDTRSNHEVHAAIVNRIAQESYTAVINTGDLVAVGSDERRWLKFLEITEPLISGFPDKPAYFPVIGNHDCFGGDGSYKLWHQYLPWLPGNGEYYVQDYANLRMIFLNSDAENDEEQLDSLEYWLASNNQEWLIVSWHYPTFPFGSKRIDHGSLTEWWPLLHKYKVDLVINGHAHYYARSYPLKPLPEVSSCIVDKENGIIQVISGGSGAGLYPIKKDRHNQAYFDFTLAVSNDQQHHYCRISVTDSTLIFDAFQMDGRIFDHFLLSRQ